MANAALAPPSPVALDGFTKLAARTLKVPVVGTLSVMDQEPRRWSAGEIIFLRELCARIVDKMEVGAALKGA